jgi:hypothetical protein
MAKTAAHRLKMADLVQDQTLSTLVAAVAQNHGLIGQQPDPLAGAHNATHRISQQGLAGLQLLAHSVHIRLAQFVPGTWVVALKKHTGQCVAVDKRIKKTHVGCVGLETVTGTEGDEV